MTISLPKLITALDEILMPQLFPDACPNGLQVEGKNDISKMAFAVTASLNVIEKAIENEVDALFVHHGLFWNRDPYPIVGYRKKRIKALLDNNISLLAYHLPLDAHPVYGNNWKAAIDLGFENLLAFGEYDKKTIGVQGTFQPILKEEFKAKLEKYYKGPVQTVYGGKDRIASAAIVSGNAWRKIEEAASLGIDCFITGSVDEPVLHLAKELGVNFYAAGHHVSEKIGPLAILEQMKLKGIKTVFIDEENPF